MERTTLGRTGIEVSAWCLGTMTWGRQTDAAGAHAQMEAALEAGIDFLDAAEMYPVNPVRAESVGDTETIIGDWIARTGRRDEWVVATKMVGAGSAFVDGRPVTPETMVRAVDGSLARLRTDVIDLYQLHWPTRGSYMFRQNWTYDPSKQPRDAADEIGRMAEAMAGLIRAGKIRAFGPSNESAWGMIRWGDALRAAGVEAGAASVQNEYSLMCRLYDTDLAEASVQEGFTLLAFSPLAAGLLTGKYADGAIPEGSRAAINGDLGGRWGERAHAAAAAYVALAREHGVDPVHMAIAWCRQRPFDCIPIFGATTRDQLGRILAGASTVLPDELLSALDDLHRAHPMPY